ncbi:MAG: aconitate hydratase [Candidatus Bathyarchaeia archaeon]
MRRNLVEKIVEAHLVEGELKPGREIALKIDQVLIQDATGTTVALEYESMNLGRVKTNPSVIYVDHNTLQTGFENADDHRYLQTFAAKYGLYFSKPGNGICHQVNLERFSRPGRTLLGSDSHTPMAGAVAMLGIGAGGLDVVLAMAGQPFYTTMPKVVGVELKGKLKPWVSGKDIALEMLRRLGVKGGLGKAFEYYGDGLKHLSVSARATICNMGTEVGATTSIFPSDQVTKRFFEAQQRLRDWKPLQPDGNAEYDEYLEVNLEGLEPLIACPSSPDNVKPVREVEGIKVHQVLVGSCVNSSLEDLMLVSKLLARHGIHPEVSFAVAPGSRQVLEALAEKGALKAIIAGGARMLESACDGCIGMGQAPPTDAVSLRTYNRNYPGRSGTRGDKVYLCSPQVAAASAIRGVITDPRKLGTPPRIPTPNRFPVNDRHIIPPSERWEEVQVIRGPNIKPIPLGKPLDQSLGGEVLLKLGDDVTTDQIMPAGSQILPLRSNILKLSEFVFKHVDPSFAERARRLGGGIIVAGENYGQGSSREHAALAPAYLGVKAVMAKSFARIHRDNLINFAVIPLRFKHKEDYGKIEVGDYIELPHILERLREHRNMGFEASDIGAYNRSKGFAFTLINDLTRRQVDIVIYGGALNYALQRLNP